MNELEAVKMEKDIPLTTLYEETAGATFQDGFTGLFNHGFFQLILDREIKRSERQGKPFTLALVDVWRFNHYNLKHGYPRGVLDVPISGYIRRAPFCDESVFSFSCCLDRLMQWQKGIDEHYP